MTAVLRKLRSASRLSLADWFLFTRAWVWLLLFDLGLRTRPFPEMQTLASRTASSPSLLSEQIEEQFLALQIAVDRARYNHLYPMTCLRRALTLQRLLAKRGISTELKIGARKDNGQLNAHAWIEYKGQTIGESEEITERFSVLEKDPQA